MRIHDLKDEAAECRRKAQSYAGRPEEPFLLRLACSFEELAAARENADMPA